MLESIEGRRGMVRFKPPIPAIEGLFGKPTVINNVVSFATVPIIIERGGEFFRDYGVGNSRGTIPFQLAGNAKRPGLIEKSMGVTLREIVYDYGGGTASGKAGSRGAGGRAARRIFSRIDARRGAGLRINRGARRNPRPRRNRGFRRHRRHGADGALRDGILRDRIVRQMHAVPNRIDSRHRGDRRHCQSAPPARESRGAARSVRHDEVWLAVRARRSDAAAGSERAKIFSRGLRSGSRRR